jgi:hypothetical protein
MNSPCLATLSAFGLLLCGCNDPNMMDLQSGGKLHEGKNLTIASGQLTKVDWFYSTYLDCTETPGVTGRVINEPAHGTVRLEHSQDFPKFDADNPHSRCNSQRVPVWIVSYSPSQDFVGMDAFSYDKTFADGQAIHVDVNVNVR